MRIVGADEGRALNREFRGKDHATNVLTFDYERAPAVRRRPRAVRAGGRARGGEQGIALEAHYAHLLVHGALHAQGFDHERDAEAKRDGGARERDPGRPRLRRSLRRLDRLRPSGRAAARRHITEAIATSTRTIAAPSCQCSCSFSHQAPETVPSTGISITDMLEATGGRLRARISQIGCAKPKIRTAL